MSGGMDWSRWPNFREDEFRCKCGTCGGKVEMVPAFLYKLQVLRDSAGFPMTITSGYRCAAHSAERNKAQPGAHRFGVAADIACDSRQAYLLIQAAVLVRVTGIGVSQRAGQPRFVHLDIWDHPSRPNVWSY